MRAELIPADGSSPVIISKDVTVVGRKSGICDVVIDHGSISKIHCVIARTDGLLFVRDLGSTNGTKVNGQRIVRGALLPNDELAFGKFKFKVFLGPAASDASVINPEHTEAIPVNGSDHNSSSDVIPID